MTYVLNSLIELGKTVLKDTIYLDDERWANGVKSFYKDNYAEIVNTISENNTDGLERISKIMLAQFKHIDSVNFWIFFSHYDIRKELTNFENKIFQIKLEENTNINISELMKEFDEIIDKFNSNYIEQEHEWLNTAVKKISTMLNSLN